jgi:hypothetical protein
VDSQNILGATLKTRGPWAISVYLWVILSVLRSNSLKFQPYVPEDALALVEDGEGDAADNGPRDAVVVFTLHTCPS